jgi:hypothetical protein
MPGRPRSLKTPEEAREQLKKRFASKHRDWLCALGEAESWPLEIALGIPSEAEAARSIDAVGAWAQSWRDCGRPGRIVWAERRWRNLGRQSLPEKLVLESAEQVAGWVGQSGRWQRAAERHRQLVQRWPSIGQALSKHFDVLADYSSEDLERLSGMLAWLEANPSSGLYPRQLPVPGLDTKWLETRTRLITDLLCALRGGGPAEQGFYALCGLRPVPALLRLRILDPDLRRRVDGLSDLSAPPSEIAILGLRPARIFVVENLQTGLAFPELPGAALFMRLGYGVDALAALPWLAGTRLYYWGDCDTHGFAILNRVRTYFPDARSLLMDERTLQDHKPLWVEEPDPHPAEDLPLLTPDERMVYRALKLNVWGPKVRLEQERVSWGYALEAIEAL